MVEEFNKVILRTAPRIREVLSYVSQDEKAAAFEIRLRKNKPLTLFGSSGTRFVFPDSAVSAVSFNGAFVVGEEDLSRTLTEICSYSVYSHQNEIAEGFVTLPGGHRAGFCGTAVIRNNAITALRDISSINIRIAGNYEGAADELLSRLWQGYLPGVIVVGAPCTGKTTVLKDVARQVSSLYKYGFKKTAVMDERFEMADIGGLCCDVLSGYPKDVGIVHAMRALSPELIICDEVATEEEAQRVIKGLNSGINFMVSLHAGSPEDFKKRPVANMLARSKGFEYTVFLGGSPPGTIEKIIKTQELVQ